MKTYYITDYKPTIVKRKDYEGKIGITIYEPALDCYYYLFHTGCKSPNIDDEDKITFNGCPLNIGNGPCKYARKIMLGEIRGELPKQGKPQTLEEVMNHAKLQKIN